MRTMPSHLRHNLATIILQVWMLLFAISVVDAKSKKDTVLHTNNKIQWGGGVSAVLAIIGGAIVCFAGYKLIRPAMFVCGFIFGGMVVVATIEALYSGKSLESASWIGFFIGGLIVGGLVVALYSVGIFLAGATGGVLLAFTINTTFGHKFYPSRPEVVLVILAVALGIIGGVLAMKIERPVLITATSFVGAQAVVWGVGYFAGDYPNGADLKKFAKKRVPAAWWGYLAGIVVLFVLGMLAQFHKTSRNVYYRSHAIPASSAEDNDQQYAEAATPKAAEKDKAVAQA